MLYAMKFSMPQSEIPEVLESRARVRAGASAGALNSGLVVGTGVIFIDLQTQTLASISVHCRLL